MREISEGSILFETYKVLSFLGEGIFGKVYKVLVLKGRYKGKVLAMKIAKDPNTVHYLMKEAQTLLLFNHPHIVSLISYIHKKDTHELFVLYELMDTDLKTHVLSRGTLSEEEALRVLFHVSQGLDYIHRRGYIHGDIKPENIFGKKVLRDVLWKLGDFSLVRIRGSGALVDVKGTVGYIAPEVFKGEVHRSSDVYSLGCVLYFMLTGRHPFYSENPSESLKKNKEGLLTFPEGLSPQMEHLLERMLSKDHTRRFKNAGELLDYLIKNRLS
ncbi:serine/threonine protein kinase [Thermocrinis minervae]|uniref:Protein kinase domain-containing protein n=1 Tax=Thermocrinis minervae TaxID=381751 RepID=A0A1M6RLT5_9AQUI|nr:serine/threonine-protein kinase [Thermocrinis minervae]SHK33415.1 hypothetical protein/serine/threonine protein kinase [Thermocrinis minervae]